MDHNREKKEKLAKNQQRVEENRGGFLNEKSCALSANGNRFLCISFSPRCFFSFFMFVLKFCRFLFFFRNFSTNPEYSGIQVDPLYQSFRRYLFSALLLLTPRWTRFRFNDFSIFENKFGSLSRLCWNPHSKRLPSRFYFFFHTNL